MFWADGQQVESGGFNELSNIIEYVTHFSGSKLGTSIEYGWLCLFILTSEHFSADEEV
jgi:hypothetical protein